MPVGPAAIPRPERTSAGGEYGQLIRLPHTGRKVLFVCDSGVNATIAAAFFEVKAGPLAQPLVATTGVPEPLSRVDRAVMAELGIDASVHQVDQVNDRLARQAAQIVVLGSATDYQPPSTARVPLERWPLDEPRHRGIDGLARLRLIRDGIEANVNILVAMLGLDASAP